MSALCSLGLLSALAPGSFRFSRPVEARAGWSRLALPDDVLDACRPGLPDLRLSSAGGEEIPYTLEEAVLSRPSRLALSDVESLPRKETTALLDRGAAPAPARSVDLEIAESEFLKPVVLEASQDGTSFREVARGSLFAGAGVRSTTLRFAANDRRYWRFRFDDRNGDPIHPSAARVGSTQPQAAPREIPLAATPAPDEPGLLAARLPAGNLGVTALRLTVGDPAFERPARVYERIFFRDEVARRLIGSGVLRRAPGGPDETEIAVGDPAGRNLEIEIDNADAPPLRVGAVTALARRRAILFSGPGNAVLLYGSAAAAAPRYDLAAALSAGGPPAASDASLGAPRESGAAPLLASPPRGSPVDPDAWTRRQPVRNVSTEVAYLDLSGRTARELASVRLIDAANRQIPYIVESGPRARVRPAALTVRERDRRTRADLTGLDPADPPDAVTLFASGPDFFSRQVRVVEIARDARGPAGEELLGAAQWERRPDAPPAPLTIPIAPPREAALLIEVENGDNAPLLLERAQIHVPFVRIDFVAPPGEPLTLLSGNPQASTPRYDLAMVADRVLASAAHPVNLGPPETPRAARGVPRWFWIAVVGAAVLVVVALLRVLTAPVNPEDASGAPRQEK